MKYNVGNIIIFLALLVTFSFFTSCTSITSYGDIYWENIYGGESETILTAVIPLEGGNFVASGMKRSGGGDTDGWILVVDKSGVILWEEIYDRGDNEIFHSLCAANNGYIAVGKLEGGRRSWVLKIDLNGNVIWEHAFGQSIDGELLSSVASVEDSNYLIAGKTKTQSGEDAGRLLLINENGSIIWDRSYQIEGRSEFRHAISAGEGASSGYIAAGIVINENENMQGLLVRVDEKGDEVWIRQYGGDNNDGFETILHVPEGAEDAKYIISGTKRSDMEEDPSKTSWLMSTDLNGRVLRDNTYGPEDYEYIIGYFMSSILLPDNGILSAGCLIRVVDSENQTQTTITGDIYICQTNSMGQVEWERIIPADRVQYPTVQIAPSSTEGGGYVLAIARNESSGIPKGLLIRMDQSGNY